MLTSHADEKADSPYLSNSAGVDWRKKRSGTQATEPILGAPRLTVAWVFARPPPETHVDLRVAAAWHEFLNEAALEILQEWGHCVNRIVYRHTVIPFMSVRLSPGGRSLVREQDKEMHEESWRFV